MSKQKSLVIHRSDDAHPLPHKSLKTRSSRMRDINAKTSNLSFGNNSVNSIASKFINFCQADNYNPQTGKWSGQFHSWNCKDGISDEWGCYLSSKNLWRIFNHDKWLGGIHLCDY